MKKHVLRVEYPGGVLRVEAEAGQSLLAALRSAGITSLAADCGGRGVCGRCAVRVRGLTAPVGGGTAEYSDGLLPACRRAPAGDCDIALARSEETLAETGAQARIPAGGSGLGAAVDIGTTTIAAAVYDLSRGVLLGETGERNAQAAFGADVISRISCAAAGGLPELRDTVREQVRRLIAGLGLGEPCRVAVAGNTVMEHIYAGLSPVSIGAAPFRPESLFGAELGGAYLCPCVSGYVGGDITAGLLSSGACMEERPCLFVDVGTNGEMALGGRGGFLCCSTAAGPAFEGASTDCGGPAADGALSGAVWTPGGGFAFTVIGGGDPASICGSGFLELLKALLDAGAVTDAGRLLPPEQAPESARGRLGRGGDGRVRFYINASVWVSEGDVRALQMAKAAICAGIETLLARSGLGAADIGRFILAGGFGAHIDPESACAVGLFPRALGRKMEYVGNSSLKGAALALDGDMRRVMESVAAGCEYMELSQTPDFAERYVENMMFEEYSEI